MTTGNKIFWYIVNLGNLFGGVLNFISSIKDPNWISLVCWLYNVCAFTFSFIIVLNELLNLEPKKNFNG